MSSMWPIGPLVTDEILFLYWCTFQIFWGVSWSEDRGGSDNSIQIINLGGWVTKVLKNGDKK